MGEFQSILTRRPASFDRHGSLHVMFLSDVELVGEIERENM
jgi:hypothetical protein